MNKKNTDVRSEEKTESQIRGLSRILQKEEAEEQVEVKPRGTFVGVPELPATEQ